VRLSAHADVVHPSVTCCDICTSHLIQQWLALPLHWPPLVHKLPLVLHQPGLQRLCVLAPPNVPHSRSATIPAGTARAVVCMVGNHGPVTQIACMCLLRGRSSNSTTSPSDLQACTLHTDLLPVQTHPYLISAPELHPAAMHNSLPIHQHPAPTWAGLPPGPHSAPPPPPQGHTARAGRC
jgi:hypothetical protein